MTAPATAIRPDGDESFWVPDFAVRLGGTEVDARFRHDVLAVTYRDDLTKIDRVELTLNNWDAGERRFAYGDDTRIEPGRPLEVSLGYLGRLQKMITAEITGLKPTYPASGAPTIGVSGLNVLHRLRRGQVTDSYTDLTDTEIATRVCQRLGLPLERDPEAAAAEPVVPYVLQDNEYDIVFLLDRARRRDYEIVVTEATPTTGARIRFAPPAQRRRPVQELHYGRSIISFTPTLTTARQVGTVEVRGWDRVRKKPIVGTATRAQLGGPVIVEQSFNARREILTVAVVNEQEATRLARDALARIADDMVTATVTTVGLPDLRAGASVLVSGTERRFDGRYLVTASTHTLGGGGYTTTVECRRELS